MHCKQARRQIADMSQHEGATLALTQHLLQCDSCRKFLEERRVLHSAVARLRAETAGVRPSDNVEERVLAALNIPGPKLPPAAGGWRWLVASALVFAAICIAAFLITMHRVPLALSPQSAAIPADEPFTAMPYVIPPAPYERTAVVRTEVPLQVMLLAGFQVHGEDLDATTLADVLYGEDGRILAIRLVSQPYSFSTKRMD